MVHVTEKLNIYIYEFITTLLSEDGQMDNLHTLARKSCIIKQIIICMKRDSITSLRQLYYNSPLVFKNQTQSNKILGLITKEIELTREQLHIHASEKGLIASKHIKINNLKVNHKNIYIQSDIGDKYYVILNGVKPLVLSKLKFVLIVEKETIFKQFVTSNFLEIFNTCAIVCTKGFPDFGTRNLLQHLGTIGSKFYVLTDYNPHGLLIALTLHRRNNSKYYTNHIHLHQLFWIQLLISPRICRYKESFTRRDKAILFNLIGTDKDVYICPSRNTSNSAAHKQIIDINNWSTIALGMKKLNFGYQLDSIDHIVSDIVSLLHNE